MIGLVGRKGLDGQSVDRALHHVAERGVNHTMTRQRAVATETIGNHAQPEVAATTASPCVSGMKMAFVVNVERNRLEAREALTDLVDAIQGRTFL